MMPAKKSFGLACLILTALFVASCSGVPGGNSGSGSGSGTGSTFPISATVTGLSGSGLVLQNNGKDNLAISTNGTFTFKTPVSTYAVTVLTQPSNPTQTCTVTGGTGTATAAVTSVAVACTTNPVTATIGGTISGLATGASVILQNNGGDSLTLTANGTFTFKTPVTGPTDAYAVTVLTQPILPTQICTVSNGSGTATADVTDVAVNCVLSYSIGGTVTGVVGTGLTLQNSSDNEQLAISPANGNQSFTFKNLVPTGTAYTVSIFAQPTGPVQTCVITPGTASGTATANVTTVSIVCPAVTFSLGGSVVGLAGKTPTPPDQINLPLTDNSFQLQNNTGNNEAVSQNGPFVFATPVALNGAYNVSVFTDPSTQPQGCTTWNYKGVVTGNITDILIDCAHDDWTWIDGTKTAGTIKSPQYGQFPTTPPPALPNPYTNTPGARDLGAGWTDSSGNLWLFGGLGWELSGSTAPDTLDGYLNDLWECPMVGDQCQWVLVNGWAANPVGANVIAYAQQESHGPLYVNARPGVGPVPGGRWGGATWTDNAGDLWLFGGEGIANNQQGLLNDLWKYNTFTSTWTWVGGSQNANQAGVYSGTQVPGARWTPVFWKDQSGNFWLFGGWGYDSAGNVGYLNDLWEYTGGNWVFVSGSNLANQLGVYGTQGTAASTNLPGGRQEAVGWADASGNLWLFGGEGEDSIGTPNGILNDLWVYNIASNQWTYVTGSATANQTGSYPLQTAVGPVSTIGAANTCGLTSGLTVDGKVICSPVDTTGAVPGSRWGATAWTDAGGNLWLFGGWGQDSTGTNGNGFLNDLWVYTPNSVLGQPGTWVWVKGSNTGNPNGIYATTNTRPYLTYVIWTPGGRRGATSWVDKNNEFWLFGGQGYDSTSTTGNGYLNDLWRYLPYAD